MSNTPSSSLSGTGSSYSTVTVDNEDDSQTKDCSLLDTESDIQSERIKKILDSAVYRTKLAICIPMLIEENKTLSGVLHPEDRKELFRFCKTVKGPRVSNLIDMEAVEMLELGDTSLKRRLCPEMAHLLRMLSGYKLLKSKVEEIVENIREDYNNNFVNEGKPVPQGFPYLLELERLRELMSKRTSKSAAEVIQADITTRKLETENKKLVERIKEVSTILPQEIKHFEGFMSRKTRKISLLQKELIKCNVIAKAKCKHIVKKSNNQMTFLTNEHNARSLVLKEIRDETREVYDKMLSGNVSQETTLRARRRKVEGQLNAFIAKYDADMTEKQKELDEVTKLYDEESKLCKDLKRKLAEQDKEFKPLMLEREEEYHAEMTEKMNLFMVEHAARIIQNAWRQVVLNREDKNRLRMLRKKMLQAKANAELRAKAEEAALKKAVKNAKKKTRSATTTTTTTTTTTSQGSEEESD